MTTEHKTIVVLGSGYVARFMLSLTRFYDIVLHTSRQPDKRLSWLPEHQRLRFDLFSADSWTGLPANADFLWCFPAAPVDKVRQFATALAPFRKLVVLGSTSAYDVVGSVEYPPPWIDETAPIDLSKPRVQGEECLRNEYGAVVLRLAGIYGPGRHPYDWIRSGRVALSQKYVNLIHVEDVAAVCLAALQSGTPGTAYNVSDGVPRIWREIGRRFYQKQGIPLPRGEDGRESGKRISTVKLSSMLRQAGIALHHPDLFDSLERLTKSAAATSRPGTREDC